MKALNVVEKATMKGHLIRALKRTNGTAQTPKSPAADFVTGKQQNVNFPNNEIISFNV